MKNNHSIKDYIFNTNWMLLEKFFSTGVSFFVGVYVIRYLGPEKVGLLEYSLTLTQFFFPLLGMGISGILVRELVKKTEDSATLLSSSFLLKLMLGLIPYFSLWTYTVVYLSESIEQTLLLILGLNLFLNSFLVLEYYFTSKVQGKKFSIAKVIAIALSSSLKLMLVLFEGDLIYFAAVIVLENAFYSIFLVILYLKERPYFQKPKLTQMTFFLKNGWPFMLSGYSMFFLKKIDILVVNHFLGLSAVGYYAVSSKITAILMVLPMVVLTSIFPLLVKKDSEDSLNNSLIKTYRIMFFSVAAVVFFITYFSAEIIVFIFGEAYLQSAALLSIYAWASVFMTVHMISNKWFLIKNLQKEFFYRSILAGCLNIVLSIILTNYYGITGSAIGTLISMFILAYLSLYFSKNGRLIKKILEQSLYIRARNA